MLLQLVFLCTFFSLIHAFNSQLQHKPNRAVIFDSALFHQTDKYRFKKGYTKGRINLTLLFGEMQQQSETATIDASTKQEL